VSVSSFLWESVDDGEGVLGIITMTMMMMGK